VSVNVTDEPTVEAPPRRAWWQRLPVLVAVGVLPVPFGLFFLAFIAIAMLMSDRTRDTQAKAGGAVLLFWWAYSFRQGDTTPLLSVPLLAIGAVLLAQSALRRRRGAAAGPFWVPAAGFVGAVVLAVAAFAPYGYRSAEVARDDAVQRVLAERTARPWRGIDATSYLVEGGRLRIVHKPMWFVALYEKHASLPTTADGQPCFSRREVWRVDGLTGDVSRVTYDEALAGGDPCLPIRVGTEKDLRPVPA
jgi:hypothetical protein